MTQSDADKADPPIGDSAPCIGCGFCCDGTLHEVVKLSDAEAERMRALGHAPRLEETIERLPLPCTYFSDGCCTAYEERFAACRRYRCALLRRYHAGRVTLKEARELVEQARELIARAEAAEKGCGLRIKRQEVTKELEELLKRSPQEERLEHGARLLSLVALEHFLASHFYVDKNAENSPAGAGSASSSPSP